MYHPTRPGSNSNAIGKEAHDGKLRLNPYDIECTIRFFITNQNETEFMYHRS